MSKGRHANASMVRRYHETERDNIFLRRELNAERRRHQQTKESAERTEALEIRCRELEMQVELATCAELAELKHKVAEQRDALAESDRRLRHIYGWARTLSRRLVTAHGFVPWTDIEEVRRLAAAFGVSTDHLAREFAKFDQPQWGPAGSRTTQDRDRDPTAHRASGRVPADAQIQPFPADPPKWYGRG